jgi:hypothetical protein
MKNKQEIFKIYEVKLQKEVIDNVNQSIGVNIPEKMIKIGIDWYCIRDEAANWDFSDEAEKIIKSNLLQNII